MNEMLAVRILESDRLWWQFDSRIVMDEWQFRWVGVGRVWWWIGSQPPSAFEMAVPPMANGKDSKISCHFANACIDLDWYRVSCTSLALWTKKWFQLHQHECSGANNSAELRIRSQKHIIHHQSSI